MSAFVEYNLMFSEDDFVMWLREWFCRGRFVIFVVVVVVYFVEE